MFDVSSLWSQRLGLLDITEQLYTSNAQGNTAEEQFEDKYRGHGSTWKCCLIGSGIPMVCRLLLGGQGRVVLP